MTIWTTTSVALGRARIRLASSPWLPSRKRLSHRRAWAIWRLPTDADSGGPSQRAASASAPHKGATKALSQMTTPLTHARPPVSLRRRFAGTAWRASTSITSWRSLATKSAGIAMTTSWRSMPRLTPIHFTRNWTCFFFQDNRRPRDSQRRMMVAILLRRSRREPLATMRGSSTKH